MPENNEIKEELLKQMDNNSHVNAKSAQKIIAQDMARVRRMKWVTAFSWLLVVICFLVTGVIQCDVKNVDNNSSYLNMMRISLTVLIFRALLLIAVFLSISLYIRSRTLTMHQIQARLAKIEEQLRRMSQGE